MQIQSDEQFDDEYEERISQSDWISPDISDNATIIETSRLILRAPKCDDIDAISILANNAAVATMLSRMPYPYSKADAAEFVNKVTKLANGNFVYAITLKETGEFIGCCGLERKTARGRLEIGYWIGEPHWGQGFATEAAHALVDLAFENCEVEEIMGSCRIGNQGSRRVLQKSGFQFFGTGIGHCLAQSAQMPIELYQLERAIWSSLKNWRPTNDQNE